MRTWAENIYQFYSQLEPPSELPNSIEYLFPQKDPQVLQVVKAFLDKYYNDSKKRRLVLGINPGRFGAGVTGVNFTAPKQLTEPLKIHHPFKQQTELSAEFIYEMIEAYGGAEKFYRSYFLGSVCPLGFVQGGKNINYYDDKELLKTIEPFIISSINTQLSFPVEKGSCFCIGGEKNYKFLLTLNEQFKWFDKIVPLPHPRFIMQYKRKQKEEYIQQYLAAFG